MLSVFMVLSVPHVEILEGDCQGRSPRLQCLWSMFFLFDVYCIKSANIKMLHISTSLVAELECFSKKQPGLSSLYAGSSGSTWCFRREQAAGGQLAWARLSMLHLWYIFMLTTFMVLRVPHVEIREGDCQGRSPRLQCLWSMFFLLMYTA